MKARWFLLVSLLPAIAACSSFATQRAERAVRVDAAWAALEQATDCCADLSEDMFRNPISDRFAVVPLPSDRARRFGPDKAFFAGFELPRYETPYYLQVGSVPNGKGMEGLNAVSFFEPVVEVYDASFHKLAEARHFSCRMNGLLPKEEMGYLGVFRIDDPTARYVLVRSETGDRNATISFSLNNQNELSALNPPWLQMHADWTLPVMPAGEVGIRVAPQKLVDKLQKQAGQGCKVIA